MLPGNHSTNQTGETSSIPHFPRSFIGWWWNRQHEFRCISSLILLTFHFCCLKKASFKLNNFIVLYSEDIRVEMRAISFIPWLIFCFNFQDMKRMFEPLILLRETEKTRLFDWINVHIQQWVMAQRCRLIGRIRIMFFTSLFTPDWSVCLLEFRFGKITSFLCDMATRQLKTQRTECRTLRYTRKHFNPLIFWLFVTNMVFFFLEIFILKYFYALFGPILQCFHKWKLFFILN